jgi:3-phosphoshikimate 1-carboxyvinyltransferase
MTVRSIHPARVHGRVRAPPSKSYTHRALVAAFLAHRRIVVKSPLDSDDTRATRDGLRVLGARVGGSPHSWTVDVERRGGVRRGSIRCGDSGTTLRFLTAVSALGQGPVRFTGTPRLASRPMEELYSALRDLGATVRTPSSGRGLPCTILGPIRPGRVTVGGDVSSQFTSALLMVLPTLAGDSELRIRGRPVSRPYIDATCAILRDRGIKVRRTRNGFHVPGAQRYRAGPIRVPGDASSAAYFWAAGAATGGSVEVGGIPANLPQADLAILPILSEMGAAVQRTRNGIRVTGPISSPVSVDLTDSPDLFPLVAVLGALVPGRASTLRGAPHLEFKESDRRKESIHLARALGAKVSTVGSRVRIIGAQVPRPLNDSLLGDHRLVMSAVVGALATQGISKVGRAEAVSKSFPGFWDAVRALTNGGESGG